MQVIVDLFDDLDGDLVSYDSITGSPDFVMEYMTGLHLPDSLVDKVDAACSDLIGELPGAEVEVYCSNVKYSANVRKA